MEGERQRNNSLADGFRHRNLHEHAAREAAVPAPAQHRGAMRQRQRSTSHMVGVLFDGATCRRGCASVCGERRNGHPTQEQQGMQPGSRRPPITTFSSSTTGYSVMDSHVCPAPSPTGAGGCRGVPNAGHEQRTGARRRPPIWPAPSASPRPRSARRTAAGTGRRAAGSRPAAPSSSGWPACPRSSRRSHTGAPPAGGTRIMAGINVVRPGAARW